MKKLHSLLLAASLISTPIFAFGLTGDNQIGIGQSASPEIHVNGDAVRALNSVNFTTTDADEVNSLDELNVYAQSLAAHDSSISQITVADTEVSVTYSVSVKIFGLIPATESNEALVTISSLGDTYASVQIPWWSLFVPGNSSSSFSAALQATVPNIPALGTHAPFSLNAKVAILSQIEISAQHYGFATLSTF